MLFSDKTIAEYINQNFEPAWQSVRPVPIVRIDFGNGNVLTRTLHGNIATYLCGAQGEVLDILPGIYKPSAYMKQLEQFRLLAMYQHSAKPEGRAARLVSYHETLASDLEKNLPPSRLVDKADFSKALIERGTKILLRPGQTPIAETAAGEKTVAASAKSEVASWDTLVEDTQLNEADRRGKIHRLLASRSSVQPSTITKWLYREVLHADLDDPYLGLGPTLFGSYPFKDDLSMKP